MIQLQEISYGTVRPNGSGKSSIVCAIALGLACGTEVLCRATKLRDYVRHGQQSGTIELELQRSKTKHVIIQRTISAQSSQNHRNSDWLVDGVKVDEQVVKQLVEQMEINLANLCNFLPQERVSAFARVTPQERLVETMRTIGGSRMVNEHQQLVKFRDSEKELVAEITDQQKELEMNEKRNQELEVDVQRYKEHEQILWRIEMLEKKRPWIEYNHTRSEWLTAKERKQELKIEMDRLNSLHAPIVANIHELDQQSLAMDGALSTNDKQKKLIDKDVATFRKNVQAAKKKSDLKQDELNDLRKNSQAQNDDIRQLQKEIQMLERQIKKLLIGLANPKEFKAQLDVLLKDHRVATEKLDMLEKNVQDHKDTMQALSNRKKACQNKLESLSNQKQQRLQKLQHIDVETYDAALWLSQNKTRFRSQHIYEPIAVELLVKDKRFLNIAEALVNSHIMKMFVFQTTADYEQFMKECNDKRKWRVNAIELGGKKLSDYSSPMTNDQLQSFGFDCYAIDLFDAPDVILAALCDQCNLHRIPVTLKQIDDAVSVNKQLGVSSFVAGSTQFKFTQSKYGQRKVTMQMISVRPATFLSEQQVDKEQVDQIYLEISDIDALAQLELPKQRHAKHLYDQQLKVQSAAKDAKEKLTKRRKDVQAKHDEISLKQTQVAAKKVRLEELLTAPSEDERKAELEAELHKLITSQVKIVVEITEIVEQMQANVRERIVFTLQQVQCNLDRNRLNDEMISQDEGLRQTAHEQKANIERVKQLRAQAQEMLNRANLLGAPTAKEQEAFAALPETLEELDLLLAGERARAEMNVDTDPALIAQYETRRTRIEQYHAKLEANNAALAELRQQVDEIRDQWETSVTKCIQGISVKFAELFAHLGCVGNVQLTKHQDYDKWGLDILIRFRDNEELCELNGHRQSGGEKSVTIMMYLMALQSFSRSPFRVVDEINQGMDPRNERLVHKLLVETVCATKGSEGQYFLITPKLLPDLHYHENMTINVVYNGATLPSHNKWSKGCKLHG